MESFGEPDITQNDALTPGNKRQCTSDVATKTPTTLKRKLNACSVGIDQLAKKSSDEGGFGISQIAGLANLAILFRVFSENCAGFRLLDDAWVIGFVIF